MEGTYYRVDERRAFETGATENVLEEANTNSLNLLPIKYTETIQVKPFHIQFGLTQLFWSTYYDKCYARGFEFATKYRGQFDYIEIDNELDYRCIKSSKGSLPEHYNDDNINSLKGLANGV